MAKVAVFTVALVHGDQHGFLHKLLIVVAEFVEEDVETVLGMEVVEG